MFIGREEELVKLNKMYQSGKLEVAVIYGRRRVGKTTLINEFCKNKKTIFFAALENGAEQNLKLLSNAIGYADTGSSSNAVYKSFSDAFEKIKEMASSERLIFVIDEFPYLAQAENSISSLLQNYLDHQFKNTKLFLILCGSSLSFMENQVLGYQSPLYGRCTAQFKIMPFDYFDTSKWFPKYSPEDKALIYGITGGIPAYLEQFSPKKNVKENLLDCIFNKNAMLFEEPANLLKQELREPAMYNAILTAVASGKTKLSEISSAVGMETGLCSKYIAKLISLEILKKEIPVTDPNTKRPTYLIEDLFFRFWYTFIPNNMAAILSGRIRQAYKESIENRLSDYMDLVFEKMCKDYVLFHDENLPFIIGEIGQWWGADSKTKKQVQIDIVAVSINKQEGIIGSCKYCNKLISEDELKLMREYAQVITRFDKYYYFLFSKSGFTSSLKKHLDSDARLITLSDLYLE